jgi:hypothetical protein
MQSRTTDIRPHRRAPAPHLRLAGSLSPGRSRLDLDTPTLRFVTVGSCWLMRRSWHSCPRWTWTALRAFYEEVVGLAVEEVNDFACVMRSGGTSLRVTRVRITGAQPFTVLGWEVDDIESTVDGLVTRGTTFRALRRHEPGRARHLDRAQWSQDRVVPRPRRQRPVVDAVRDLSTLADDPGLPVRR